MTIGAAVTAFASRVQTLLKAVVVGTQVDSEMHISVTDASGNVIFEGPVETDEQREAVPDQIRVRVKQWLDTIRSLRGTNAGERP